MLFCYLKQLCTWLRKCPWVWKGTVLLKDRVRFHPHANHFMPDDSRGELIETAWIQLHTFHMVKLKIASEIPQNSQASSEHSVKFNYNLDGSRFLLVHNAGRNSRTGPGSARPAAWQRWSMALAAHCLHCGAASAPWVLCLHQTLNSIPASDSCALHKFIELQSKAVKRCRWRCLTSAVVLSTRPSQISGLLVFYCCTWTGWRKEHFFMVCTQAEVWFKGCQIDFRLVIMLFNVRSCSAWLLFCCSIFKYLPESEK